MTDMPLAPGPNTPPPVPPLPTPPRRNVRVWAWVMAGAGVILLGILIVLIVLFTARAAENAVEPEPTSTSTSPAGDDESISDEDLDSLAKVLVGQYPLDSNVRFGVEPTVAGDLSQPWTPDTEQEQVWIDTATQCQVSVYVDQNPLKDNHPFTTDRPYTDTTLDAQRENISSVDGVTDVAETGTRYDVMVPASDDGSMEFRVATFTYSNDSTPGIMMIAQRSMLASETTLNVNLMCTATDALPSGVDFDDILDEMFVTTE